MAKARRQHKNLARAQGARLSIDRDDQFALDRLDAHRPRGVVLRKARAWVEREERDGPPFELVKRLLAMAVLGSALGSQRRELGGNIKDL